MYTRQSKCEEYTYGVDLRRNCTARPSGDLRCSVEDEAGLATATQGAMTELGRRFATAQPDVTVIFTPHNVHAEEAMAVITAGQLAGSLANWTTRDVRLHCPVDRDLAHQVLEGFRANGVPAAGISYGGDDAARATAPMDWETLIPLWFMGGQSRKCRLWWSLRRVIGP